MPIQITRRNFLAGVGAGTTVLPLLASSPVSQRTLSISQERLTEIVSIFHKHFLFYKIDSMFLNQFRPWYMEESLNALKKVKSEVPELEDLSVIDIIERYLSGENERVKRLENQGSHETLTEWGAFFDHHKILSSVRLAEQYGSKSKSQLVRDVSSLLTGSPVSDFRLGLVSINLRRAVEAEKVRQVEVDDRVRQLLSQRRSRQIS